MDVRMDSPIDWKCSITTTTVTVTVTPAIALMEHSRVPATDMMEPAEIHFHRIRISH